LLHTLLRGGFHRTNVLLSSESGRFRETKVPASWPERYGRQDLWRRFAAEGVLGK
jgi:hypothetical protein